MKLAITHILTLSVIVLICIATVEAAKPHHRQSAARHHHAHHAKLNYHASAQHLREKLHADMTAAASKSSVSSSETGTAYLQQLYSPNSTTCGGEVEVFGNYSTGACSPGDGSSSYSWYCDTTGGYFVRYASLDCAPGSIALINKFDFGCGVIGQGSQQFVCVHPELGPPPPFSSWPPAGYIVTTQCGTDDSVEPRCSSGEGVICGHSAVPANKCIQDNNGYGGSAINFCTADSAYVGIASYSSDDCSDPAPVNVVLTSAACNSTVAASQCTGTPLPVSEYPAAGVYSSSQSGSCESGAGSAIIYQQSGECFQYEEFICASGPSSASITVLSSEAVDCSNTVPNVTQTYSTNECLQAPSPGLGSTQYFCNGYQN